MAKNTITSKTGTDGVELVTQEEFARRTGRTAVGIHKLAKTGKLPFRLEGERRWIEFDAAVARLGEVLDPAKVAANAGKRKGRSRPPASEVKPTGKRRARRSATSAVDKAAATIAKARIEQMLIRTESERLDLDIRKGELVNKEAVGRAVNLFVKGVRDALQMWPARVAAEIAAEVGCDAAKLDHAMVTRLNVYLADLSRRGFKL